MSYNELGQTPGIDKETVECYLELPEKVFAVFRLNSFSRNVRNEMKKSRKVYFFGNGIRNAVINNYLNFVMIPEHYLKISSSAKGENISIIMVSMPIPISGAPIPNKKSIIR